MQGDEDLAGNGLKMEKTDIYNSTLAAHAREVRWLTIKCAVDTYKISTDGQIQDVRVVIVQQTLKCLGIKYGCWPL